MPRPPILQLVLDAETRADIDALAAELGLTRSGVVRLAVRALRRAGPLTLPPPSEEEIERERRSPGRRGPRPSRAAQREQAVRGPGATPDA